MAKKDTKLKAPAIKEPKKSVIDPIDLPAVAFTERAKVKSLMRQPSKQADYKPDYLKEAQFAHQVHLKSMPEEKPSPADLISKGLMYAGDVAQRLGKSAAKIEQVVESVEAPKKRGPGRPKKAESEKKPKKQTKKDKEDEKLAMEVKGTKDAVSAVAKELEEHEAESEAEEMVEAKAAPKKKSTKAKEGTVDKRKIRGARIKGIMEKHKVSMAQASKMLAEEDKKK